MCHIGTYSTRYCMRTVEKVWRLKVKNMVCRVSKNDTRQITGGGSLPSVRIITLGKDEFYRVLLFAECSALGKPPLCRVPVVRRVLSL